MSKRNIAETFLKLASSGRVREAYEHYVHPNFRHHNAYFKGDRQSLLVGMEESARNYPDKRYATLRPRFGSRKISLSWRHRSRS